MTTQKTKTPAQQRRAKNQALIATANAIAFGPPVVKPPAAKPGRNRPSVAYSPAVVEAICQGIASGKSLLAVCNGAGMPSRPAVFKWLDRHPEFAAAYKAAMEHQAISVFDEMAEIEKDVLSGKVPPDVGRVVLGSKQWRASKLNRKLFGDQVGVTGPGGGPLQQVTRIELVAVAPEQQIAIDRGAVQTVIELKGED